MKKFLFCLVCFWTLNILATPAKFYSNNLNRCKLTRAILNDYEPKNFEPTNNLLRKTGQWSKYHGEKILIKGIILDQNCVPVSDAKVYLWQVGTGGRYPYEPLRVRVDKKRFFTDYSSSFTGSGTATTNNKGEYYFISMLPYKSSHSVASVNVRVERRNFVTLQTRLELSQKNICTYECGEMLPSIFNAEMDITAYCFDLVLQGSALKRY